MLHRAGLVLRESRQPCELVSIQLVLVGCTQNMQFPELRTQPSHSPPTLRLVSVLISVFEGRGWAASSVDLTKFQFSLGSGRSQHYLKDWRRQLNSLAEQCLLSGKYSTGFCAELGDASGFLVDSGGHCGTLLSAIKIRGSVAAQVVTGIDTAGPTPLLISEAV